MSGEDRCFGRDLGKVLGTLWVGLCLALLAALIGSRPALATEFRQLTHFAESGGAWSLDVSADGSRVVFLGFDGSIWGVDGDGAGLHRIVPDTVKAGWLCISADGTRLLFASSDDPAGGNSQHAYQAFVVSWDGTGLRQVSTSGISDACLSGSGEVIAFESGATGRSQIYLVSWDGTGLRQITDNPDPTWWMWCLALDYSGSHVAFSSYLCSVMFV